VLHQPTNRKESQVVMTLEHIKLVHELLDIEIDNLSVDPINVPDIKNLVAIKSRIHEGIQMGEKIYFKLTRRQIGKIISYMRIPNDPYFVEGELQ
jgi:hypothetical protein